MCHFVLIIIVYDDEYDSRNFVCLMVEDVDIAYFHVSFFKIINLNAIYSQN